MLLKLADARQMTGNSTAILSMVASSFYLSQKHTNTHAYTKTCTCCSYTCRLYIRLVSVRRPANSHRPLSERVYRWMLTMVHNTHGFKHSLANMLIAAMCPHLEL